MFGPFYTFSLVSSDPNFLIVQVFTYFALTAPSPQWSVTVSEPPAVWGQP